MSYEKLFPNEVRLTSGKFTRKLIEDGGRLKDFQKECWYLQPVNWKPSHNGELWHATLTQICKFYNLNDFQIPSDCKAGSWNDFHDSIKSIALSSNPNKSSYVLYKLKKAKWFQFLNEVQEEIIVIDEMDF